MTKDQGQMTNGDPDSSKSITLADIAPGQRAKVIAFQCHTNDSQRLREMGLVPGTMVKVIRLAPLGDPMEVEVRGYKLSLRKHEAALIEVSRME